MYYRSCLFLRSCAIGILIYLPHLLQELSIPKVLRNRRAYIFTTFTVGMVYSYVHVQQAYLYIHHIYFRIGLLLRSCAMGILIYLPHLLQDWSIIRSCAMGILIYSPHLLQEWSIPKVMCNRRAYIFTTFSVGMVYL